MLAYEITFNGDLALLPYQQHSIYKWFSEKKQNESEQVHEHSKWYVHENKKAGSSFNNKYY